MLLHKIKPDINDITLQEIVHFSRLLRSNVAIGYSGEYNYRHFIKKLENNKSIDISCNRLRDAIKYSLKNCSLEQQEKIRLTIIKQIEGVFFTAINFNGKQYWLLSSEEDNYVEKYVKNEIEYYQSINKNYQYYQDKWNPEQYQKGFLGPMIHSNFNLNFLYYREAFLYLELTDCFMILNVFPLDKDVLLLIKNIILIKNDIKTIIYIR